MKALDKKHKYLAVLSTALLVTDSSLAAGSITVEDTQSIPDQTIEFTGSNAYGIGLNVTGDNANATIAGTVTVEGKATAGEPIGVQAQNSATLEAKNLNISMEPADGATSTNPKGLLVRGTNTNVTINNLTSKVVLASETDSTTMAPDSNASYGVAVGYDHNGGNADGTTTLRTNNATIEVSNTAGTKKANRAISRANFTFGQQLSGIRVYRSTGSIPSYINDGNLNISVTDKSDSKAGDYLIGLYVDGDGSTAILNGTSNITIVANGEHSAGIKIGKPGSQTVYTAGASVEVDGKLVVDTTATADSGAVRLYDQKSKFIISGNEVSEIKSGNAAIVFDTVDISAPATARAGFLGTFRGTPSRNSDNVDNVVKLHNTKLSTTADNASLILARGRSVNDTIVLGANFLGVPTQGMNNGNFAVKNAKFTLSGEKSEATAADKGWLVEVTSAGKAAPSDLSVTIDDKAKVKGLVTKGDYDSLIMNVNNEAVWTLAGKGDSNGGDTTYTSRASDVTLNGGTLDASITPPDPSTTPYTINLATTDKDTDEVSYGTFTNGGVINMANTAYNDALYIVGNYVGNNGILRTNMEWNAPGDDAGANSQGDLLDISEKATGTTNVISVSQNGVEKIIDGDIGSIQEDLEKNSAVVVRVHKPDGIDNAFVGKAKTNGMAELQLTSRLTDEGIREYYWTITKVGKPILDPTVPAYVQMPYINMSLNLSSLSTLHQRRGENNVYKWDHFLGKENNAKQVWARYIRNNSRNWGERLGYKLHTNGVQIGTDFKVTTPENSDIAFKAVGAYLTFLRGSAYFYDSDKAENGVKAADQSMGTGRVNGYALGLTYTHYKKDNSYLDLVAQLSRFSNRYRSNDQVTAHNSGWGLALSAEMGKHKVLRTTSKGQWSLEPQGQIILQRLGFRTFHDGVRSVDQSNFYGAHLRLGMRLSYDAIKNGSLERNKGIYGIVNLWQTFSNNPSHHIGKDTMKERYAKTLGEVGLGGQIYLRRNVYLYGNLRYGFNLGSTKHRNTIGTLGLKYTF
ncbi:autotransporter outer membrane beta-barrel domain-containing protein [Avibacterium avium]|uniref:autotransporter outer membrane beta-barrel domain-containing protein n=1 Tax=Avibacterium avium TaxID=751 RepID=UPI003BF84387